jgi:hypothetical protein
LERSIYQVKLNELSVNLSYGWLNSPIAIRNFHGLFADIFLYFPVCIFYGK